jgi:hypothetical protein
MVLTEKQKENQRRYREKHKEKLKKKREKNKEITKEYYEKNKEKLLNKKKEYYEKNKKLLKQKCRNYSRINGQNKSVLFAKFYIQNIRGKGKCIDCKCTHKDWFLEFDHIDRDKKTESICRYTYWGVGSEKEIKNRLDKELENTVLRCTICHRKKTKITVRTKKQQMMYDRTKERDKFLIKEKLKRSNCNHCERDCTFENHLGFDWDHVNKEEKYKKISELRRASYKTIIKELEKCQLLCVNCHKIKTNTESRELKVV